MVRSVKALVGLMVLVAVSDGHAAGGRMVSEGDKIPVGTLVTGECYDHSKSDRLEDHDAAQTYFYDLAEPGESSSGTSQGVLPPDCEPVRLTEVARYEAITTYYRGLDYTQKTITFEVVDAKPRALYEAFIEAANQHNGSGYRSLGNLSKEAEQSCAKEDWARTEQLAASGEDFYREAAVPEHADMAAALAALDDATRRVKRAKRPAFRKAVAKWQAMVRARGAAQSAFRAALLAYGDHDCPLGNRKRNLGWDKASEAIQHSKKARRLMPAL